MSILPGLPEPLGVTLRDDGANVAVFSADAERIELCLFGEDGSETRLVLPDRTGDVHHGFVPGLGAGRLYGFRAHGPWRPQEGLRFNPAKLLIDPYATRLVRPEGLTSAMPGHGIEGLDDLVLDPTDTAPFVPKGMIEAPARPAAAGPVVAPGGRIVYELNVKGFTRRHPAIPETIRGTFAGLAHPAAIRHLVELGVTTVELMPAAAWIDERHLPGLGLSNSWGYNPAAFLAPDPRLAPGGMAEVAAAVAALHQAGLEVILDVVFNHTAESDERGQTLSLRGLDNRTYYRLRGDRRFYVNDTGCGHTLALDRPAPLRLVMDALRHWAGAGGFDGFRFDLAPVLGRTAAGFTPEAPLLAAIAQDPVLRGRLMLAEPWDIGPGGYRLGGFPAPWGEWNDRYRDDVRRFWRGDAAVGGLATRLAGSADIFAPTHRPPSASVNFVAAHDGFTLADLVSHAGKHNEANGEGNRDGHSGEVAWNNGAEGPSQDRAVAAARARDARALLATLLVSRGTPMLGMGDELGRSQAGNNNAYAQDNETTWVDWEHADRDLVDFVRRLVALRRAQPALTEDRWLTGLAGEAGAPDVTWLAPDGGAMSAGRWNDPATRTLGMLLAPQRSAAGRVLVWLHAGGEPLSVTLPETGRSRRWRRAFGAANQPLEGDDALFSGFERAELGPRSVAVFVEEEGRGAARGGDVDPAFLDRLALLAGIAPDWWEVSGKHTLVSRDTKRALLDAMGLPSATMGQARESHERLLALRPPQASADRCFVPEALTGERRRFGLSTQLYTLRRAGDQGVGDFTTLRRLAEAAAARGAATVALNPLHAMFASDRDRASPYQPSDRRFLDPIYLDLDAVPEIAAAGGRAEAPADEASGRLVDWAGVWRRKRAVLERCFEVAQSRPDRWAAVEAFRAECGEALQRFALFQALEEETGGTDFRAADPGPATSERRRAADFAVYLQFLADAQLAQAADSGLAVGLYRDLAVGAAPDGAEVWSSPGAFMKGVTVGAPPDPFSAAGQIWNIPPLDPIALQATDYAHVRELLRANMRHAGALRIDHVMALTRLFVVPQGAPAAEGAYIGFPMEGLLGVLAEESRRAGCLVVGEDLGTVPEGFRERMDAAGAFSYRVLFFERDGSAFRPPEAYPARAVACVATHDLPTLKGWWSGADLALDRRLGRSLPPEAEAERAAEKRALAAAVGQADGDLTPGLVGAIHGFLAASAAALVLAQVEDLAGEAEPVNVPGTDRDYPNWRRRLDGEAEALLETDAARAVFAAMREAGR